MAANSAIAPETTRAIAASPARKLLVPLATVGWEWCGLERLNDDALVRQAVRAVKQIVEGEEVKPARSPIITIVIIIIGACVLLQVISTFFSLLGGLLFRGY